MRDNYSAINANRQAVLAKSDSQRISVIARLANGYQSQGLRAPKRWPWLRTGPSGL